MERGFLGIAGSLNHNAEFHRVYSVTDFVNAAPLIGRETFNSKWSVKATR